MLVSLIMLAVIVLYQFVIARIEKRHEVERYEWQVERKDLMDRIQAPSFHEYTNKVVREKRAERPEEKADPIEFIS